MQVCFLSVCAFSAIVFVSQFKISITILHCSLLLWYWNVLDSLQLLQLEGDLIRMLFLIKWYHLKWVFLPLSHCSVKITTEENHLVILFCWLKCLYSFIFYMVKFHLNERPRAGFLTQLIMCPHIPITVSAQFCWIQQQHVSVDPYVRRKPKVGIQAPEIKQRVLQRVLCLQSSLGESYVSLPPQANAV